MCAALLNILVPRDLAKLAEMRKKENGKNRLIKVSDKRTQPEGLGPQERLACDTFLGAMEIMASNQAGFFLNRKLC